MNGLSGKWGVVAANVAERTAVSLLVGISALFERGAPRTIARGYTDLLARSSLGGVVGNTIHYLGAAAHPDRLVTARADLFLRSLIAGRKFSVQRSLTELERFELAGRYTGFAASTTMLWLAPFIYGTNPSRLRLNPAELATLVRRFRELLASDIKNIGREFPRDVAGLTHLDLDARQTSKAFAQMHAAMLRAIRSGSTSVPSSTGYPAQRFHWRDWQDPKSAASWDIQVDTLFGGLYGAMERSVIPDVLEGLDFGGGRLQRILEVGGGTGSLAHSFLRTLEWRGQLSGVTFDFADISDPNMALAKKRLARWGDRVHFFDFATTGACAEKLPHENCSVDALIVMNLFHELPHRFDERPPKNLQGCFTPEDDSLFLIPLSWEMVLIVYCKPLEEMGEDVCLEELFTNLFTKVI